MCWAAAPLWTAAVEDVPEGDYEIPLGKARMVQPGTDITLVGWGQQVKVLELAVSDRRQLRVCCRPAAVQATAECVVSPPYPSSCPLQAKEVADRDGISCEVIDLRTLLPWDAEAVETSVRKTGR